MKPFVCPYCKSEHFSIVGLTAAGYTIYCCDDCGVQYYLKYDEGNEI